MSSAPALTRPRARGWIHFYSAIVAAVVGVTLTTLAATIVGARAAWACAVYSVTITALFSVSATYHRHTWVSERSRVWMKRLDHSMIFLFIAGTYTPFAMLALPSAVGELGAGGGLGGRRGRHRPEDRLAARTALAGRSDLPGAGLGGDLRHSRTAGHRRRHRGAC